MIFKIFLSSMSTSPDGIFSVSSLPDLTTTLLQHTMTTLIWQIKSKNKQEVRHYVQNTMKRMELIIFTLKIKNLKKKNSILENF